MARNQTSRLSGYTPGWTGLGWWLWDEEATGYLTWWEIERMRRTPPVVFGLWVIYSPLRRAKLTVTCKNPRAQKFIESTLKTVWKQDLTKILDHLVWGHQGGWVRHEESGGHLQFAALQEVSSVDIRPLVDRRRGGTDLWGVRVNNVTLDGRPKQHVDLRCGREWGEGWWIANEPRHGSLYGYSRLINCWVPWNEKFGQKGAAKARRLWYAKNAFHGGTLKYPDKSYEDPQTGQERHAQDLAREILEKFETGGVLAIPNDRDDNGNPEWEYAPPQVNGDLRGVDEYAKGLDAEIWQGLGIPEEVVQAAESGSGYAGRSVPAMVFYTGEDAILHAVLECIKAHVLDYLVRENFGDVAYDIEAESLVPKDPDEQPPGGEAPPGMGGPPGEGGGGEQPPDAGGGGGMDSILEQLMGGGGGSPAQLSLPIRLALGRWEKWTLKSGPNKGKVVWRKEIAKGRYRYNHGEQEPGKRDRAASPDDTAGRIKGLKESGLTSAEHVQGAIDDLMHMTREQMHAVKKALGLRASGAKKALAEKIAKMGMGLMKTRAQAKAKAAPEAQPQAGAQPEQQQQPQEAQPAEKPLPVSTAGGAGKWGEQEPLDPTAGGYAGKGLGAGERPAKAAAESGQAAAEKPPLADAVQKSLADLGFDLDDMISPRKEAKLREAVRRTHAGASDEEIDEALRDVAAGQFDITLEGDAGQAGDPEGEAATPATPEQGKAARESILGKVSEAVKGNADLSDEQRQAYTRTMQAVVGRLSHTAAHRVSRHLAGGARFYANAREMGVAAYAAARNSPQWKTLSDERKTQHLRVEAEIHSGASVLGGAYSSLDQSLHLDGEHATAGDLRQTGYEAAADPDQYRMSSAHDLKQHIYAHELGHAIDGPGFKLSKSAEWRKVHGEEITAPGADANPLSLYSTTNVQESFAEFARLLYGGGVDLSQVERDFPQASQFFKERGLWPEQAEQPEQPASAGAAKLPEIFQESPQIPGQSIDILHPDVVGGGKEEAASAPAADDEVYDVTEVADGEPAEGAQEADEVYDAEVVDDGEPEEAAPQGGGKTLSKDEQTLARKAQKYNGARRWAEGDKDVGWSDDRHRELLDALEISDDDLAAGQKILDEDPGALARRPGAKDGLDENTGEFIINGHALPSDTLTDKSALRSVGLAPVDHAAYVSLFYKYLSPDRRVTSPTEDEDTLFVLRNEELPTRHRLAKLVGAPSADPRQIMQTLADKVPPGRYQRRYQEITKAAPENAVTRYADGQTRKVQENLPPSHVRHFGEGISRLGDKDRGALKSYVNGNKRQTPEGDKNFRDLNTALRDNPDAPEGWVKEWMDDLHAAIDKQPALKEPVNLYRGLTLPKAEREDFLSLVQEAIKTGGSIQMPGVTSASLNPAQASMFGNKIDESTALMLEIAGKKGVYLGHDVPGAKDIQPGNEWEFIMKHNSMFRPVGIKKVKYWANGRVQEFTTVQMEQIPDGEKDVKPEHVQRTVKGNKLVSGGAGAAGRGGATGGAGRPAPAVPADGGRHGGGGAAGAAGGGKAAPSREQIEADLKAGKDVPAEHLKAHLDLAKKHYWGNKKYQPFYRPGANPTVDNVLTRDNPKTGRREVLLIRRAEKDKNGDPVAEGGKWALPGGFHDTKADKGEPWREGHETAEQAAARELKEETGLDFSGRVQHVGQFDKRGRDPRDNDEAWSVSNAYHAHLGPEDFERSSKVQGLDDADNAEWVPLDEAHARGLAFDHGDILKAARKHTAKPAEARPPASAGPGGGADKPKKKKR